MVTFVLDIVESCVMFFSFSFALITKLVLNKAKSESSPKHTKYINQALNVANLIFDYSNLIFDYSVTIIYVI